MRHVTALGLATITLLSVGVLAAACGGDPTSTFEVPVDAGVDTGPDPEVGEFGDEQEFGNGCKNLQCKQVQCAGGSEASTTTIKGKVFDPRGVNPIYNAVVYIPNGTVEAFDDNAGVTCDRCNGAQASGSPIVVDLTKADGSFELKNVPVDVEVPIVVQVGKWRRVLTLPAVERCKVTEITDVNTFRLPRNKSEGHIPKMAVALGGADPFECLLRKIGIDDGEFTNPDGAGRIHTYRASDWSGTGGDSTFNSYKYGASSTMPTSNGFTADMAKWKSYDVSLLACEGNPVNADKPAAMQQSQQTYDNFRDYLNAGGRAFVTHYSKTFVEGHRADMTGPVTTPGHFGGIGTFEYARGDRSDSRWYSGSNFCFEASMTCTPSSVTAADVLPGLIDVSFPKGQAFRDWLWNTKRADEALTEGQLPITDWRHNLKSVDPANAQQWVTADTGPQWSDASARAAAQAGPVVQHITFNTPLNAPVDANGETTACGKVVFSDFHVAEQLRNRGAYFPASCGNAAAPMTAQERALEFMLFDLSSCIQKEDALPLPPRPR